MSLFDSPRQHFFRVLVGKYRAHTACVLEALYLAEQSGQGASGFGREALINLILQTIAPLAPLDEEEDGEDLAPRSGRELAAQLLRQLLEHGWLEKQVDEITLVAHYALSQHGRAFALPLVDLTGARFRTRHRNTRNIRNALHRLVACDAQNLEIYDLLDALEYSERIISDFSDVIAELEERKRQLVREVNDESQLTHASAQFFEFMQQRFLPDLAIRLSADSVEKYRDEIHALLQRAWRKPRAFKAQAERDLRKLAPELIGVPTQSVYKWVLDSIGERVHNAANIMLPSLREALHSFTRRADLIIRQLSHSNRAQRDRWQQAMNDFRSADPDTQAARLAAVGAQMAGVSVQLADTDALRLMQRRRPLQLDAVFDDHDPPADDDCWQAFSRNRAMEMAFGITRERIANYASAHIPIDTPRALSELPIESADDLLANAHLLELANQAGWEVIESCEPVGPSSQPYVTHLDTIILRRRSPA